MDEKVLVIIPAYNEEESISQVVHEVKKAVPFADIVVINDGSTDNTAIKAKGAGAKVISHLTNQGYGAALQTGFIYAVEKGYPVIVQLDADGQHDPASIPSLLKSLREGETDLVIGSRFLEKRDYRVKFNKKIGIYLFGKIASLITRRRITDPTSGFQAFNKDVIRFFTQDLYPSDYPDADVLIMVYFAGFRFKEVPVKMHYSPKDETMHRGYKAFYYIFKMLLSIIVTLLRKK